MMIEAMIIKYHALLKEWEKYRIEPDSITHVADAKVTLLREIIADLTLLMNKGR